MELFSEIYSTYYNAVEHLLHAAYSKPLEIKDIQSILTNSAFSESTYQIMPKLQSGDWPLLIDTDSGYTTRCLLPAEKPLTNLQRSWIKALLGDPRIHLFFDDKELAELSQALSDIPPLFHPHDFHTNDAAKDGDCFDDVDYQQRFRLFLHAIHKREAVAVQYQGGKGHRSSGVFWPYRIEYSRKDDKLRALCYRRHGLRKTHCILNLGRVLSAHIAQVDANIAASMQEHWPPEHFAQLTLDISKERNALERCMIQFAHLEKRTEYDEFTERYTCFIKYNILDESELVIRVLSFGPTVRVLGPARFLQELRQRVQKQTMLLNQPKQQDATLM